MLVEVVVRAAQGAVAPGSVSPADRHLVVVNVDAPVLATGDGDVCELDGGPGLPAETARRIACDADIVELCRFHHRLVHEGGWTLTLDPDGTVVFTSPDGVTVASTTRPRGGSAEPPLDLDLALTALIPPGQADPHQRIAAPLLEVGPATRGRSRPSAGRRRPTTSGR